MLSELQKYYKNYFPEYEGNFIFQENAPYVSISNVQIISVEHLKAILIRENRKTQILVTTFLERKNTVNELLETLNISYPSLRRDINEINNFLRKRNISLTTDLTLQGNEYEIRSLMFEIFYCYFDIADLPFKSNLDTLLPKILKQLPGSHTLTLSQRKAFQLASGIVEIRVNQQKIIQKPLDFINIDSLKANCPTLFEMIKFLFPSLTLVSKHYRPYELEYAILSITFISHVATNKIKKALSTKALSLLGRIETIFVEEHEQFFNKKLTPEHIRIIMDNLFILNIQFLTMHKMLINHPIYNKKDYVLYFYSYELAKKICHRISQVIQTSPTLVEKSLLNEYTVALHDYIIGNNTILLPRVNIFVDMHDLPNLSNEITHILSQNTVINLRPRDSLNQNVDIVISDIPITNKNFVNIVWRALPSYHDIENLHKIAGLIMQKKLRAIKKR